MKIDAEWNINLQKMKPRFKAENFADYLTSASVLQIFREYSPSIYIREISRNRRKHVLSGWNKRRKRHEVKYLGTKGL